MAYSSRNLQYCHVNNESSLYAVGTCSGKVSEMEAGPLRYMADGSPVLWSSVRRNNWRLSVFGQTEEHRAGVPFFVGVEPPRVLVMPTARDLTWDVRKVRKVSLDLHRFEYAICVGDVVLVDGMGVFRRIEITTSYRGSVAEEVLVFEATVAPFMVRGV